MEKIPAVTSRKKQKILIQLCFIPLSEKLPTYPSVFTPVASIICFRFSFLHAKEALWVDARNSKAIVGVLVGASGMHSGRVVSSPLRSHWLNERFRWFRKRTFHSAALHEIHCGTTVSIILGYTNDTMGAVPHRAEFMQYGEKTTFFNKCIVADYFIRNWIALFFIRNLW